MALAALTCSVCAQDDTRHRIIAAPESLSSPAWRILRVDDLPLTEQARAFAGERLKMWQQRLGLTHWRVSLEVVRASALRGHSIGDITPDLATWTATIRLLDPADYQPTEDQMRADVESIVVHELIHLSLTPALAAVRADETTRRQEEAAVQNITAAILKGDKCNSR
jgi:hypothetical protein